MKKHTEGLTQSTCFEPPRFLHCTPRYLASTQPGSVVAGAKIRRRSRGREHEFHLS